MVLSEKGAVLLWWPRKEPKFRELPKKLAMIRCVGMTPSQTSVCVCACMYAYLYTYVFAASTFLSSLSF